MPVYFVYVICMQEFDAEIISLHPYCPNSQSRQIPVVKRKELGGKELRLAPHFTNAEGAIRPILLHRKAAGWRSSRTHPETRLWAILSLKNKVVSEPTEGFRTASRATFNFLCPVRARESLVFKCQNAINAARKSVTRFRELCIEWGLTAATRIGHLVPQDIRAGERLFAAGSHLENSPVNTATVPLPFLHIPREMQRQLEGAVSSNRSYD